MHFLNNFFNNLKDIFNSSQCSQPSDFMDTSFNIAIHVAILFLILSLFFVFYISKIEQETINKQIENNIAKELKPKIKAYLQNFPEQIAVLNGVPFGNLTKIYEQPDIGVSINNSWLFNMIWIVNCVLILLIIVSYIIIKKSCGKCVDMVDLLKFNFTAFFFIGVVEILFFYFIASKYDPIKPSIFITTFIDKLKTVLK